MWDVDLMRASSQEKGYKNDEYVRSVNYLEVVNPPESQCK